MARGGSSGAAAELLSFLIADIRGYTSFTQSRGDEAAEALAGKFALVAREGIEAHGGRLLELRGDEALAVFGSARAWLRAAVGLQEVFADETRLEPRLPLMVGDGARRGGGGPGRGWLPRWGAEPGGGHDRGWVRFVDTVTGDATTPTRFPAVEGDIVQRAIDVACRMAGRTPTEEEWEQHLPEQPFRDVCPRAPE